MIYSWNTQKRCTVNVPIFIWKKMCFPLLPLSIACKWQLGPSLVHESKFWFKREMNILIIPRNRNRFVEGDFEANYGLRGPGEKLKDQRSERFKDLLLDIHRHRQKLQVTILVFNVNKMAALFILFHRTKIFIDLKYVRKNFIWYLK